MLADFEQLRPPSGKHSFASTTEHVPLTALSSPASSPGPSPPRTPKYGGQPGRDLFTVPSPTSPPGPVMTEQGLMEFGDTLRPASPSGVHLTRAHPYHGSGAQDILLVHPSPGSSRPASRHRPHGSPPPSPAGRRPVLSPVVLPPSPGPGSRPGSRGQIQVFPASGSRPGSRGELRLSPLANGTGSRPGSRGELAASPSGSRHGSMRQVPVAPLHTAGSRPGSVESSARSVALPHGSRPVSRERNSMDRGRLPVHPIITGFSSTPVDRSSPSVTRPVSPDGKGSRPVSRGQPDWF